MNCRNAGVVLLLAVLGCTAHTETRTVRACPLGADFSHPSEGRLVSLPSEVPGLSLDSMRWAVQTVHRELWLETITTLAVSGRIVATEEVSLRGVGVLVEGMRDSAVSYGEVIKEFVDVRQNPVFAQAGQVISLERARPERPVPVSWFTAHRGVDPSPAWGCPTRVRIVRYASADTTNPAQLIPLDEYPNSDFYPWNPLTFDLDSVVAKGRPVVAMSRVDADGSRTELVVVRSKVLYRRRVGDVVRADSARVREGWGLDAFEKMNSVRGPSPFGPPEEGNVTISIQRGTVIQRRFTAGQTPAELVPLMNVLSVLEKSMAPKP